MNRPLFSIGEDVLVKSKNYSHVDGEYRVKEILTSEEACIRATGDLGHVKSFPGEYYYVLSGLLFEDKNIKTVKYDFMNQRSLRKIHKPSQLTFEQLISEIKCPSRIA